VALVAEEGKTVNYRHGNELQLGELLDPTAGVEPKAGVRVVAADLAEQLKQTRRVLEVLADVADAERGAALAPRAALDVFDDQAVIGERVGVVDAGLEVGSERDAQRAREVERPRLATHGFGALGA
jgi:hypothetical protein